MSAIRSGGSGSVSLENFSQSMRDYQLDVIEDAEDFVVDAITPNLADYGQAQTLRRLYASPTGTGKGSMQLMLLKQLRAQGYNAWLLSPALEVLRGCLERCGADKDTLLAAGPERLADLGRDIFVTTPMRCQNGVLRGEWGMPDVVIYDEAHHAIEDNEVSGTLFALAPEAVWLGFTATPYRGTPRGTKALREAWGEPILVMDIPEAVSQGYMNLPSFRVVPLVDDDKIKVENGRFQVKGSNKAVRDRMVALVNLVEEEWGPETDSRLPMCVTVPSTAVAADLVLRLEERGLGARMVIGTTPAKQRAQAYYECQQRLACLVSVKVLNEGVDLPWLKVLIDARPTVSPVSFVQQVGRIMRPGGARPEYICVCRNLERHAYLLGGAVPREVVVEAQEAFDAPTKRDGHRSLGFEALARFKRIPVPLDGNLRGSMFNVHSLDNEGNKVEWCVITTPLSEAAIVARRETQIVRDEDGAPENYINGKWVAADLPADLAGFATSQQKGALSKKQAQWWERSAQRYGLDKDAAEDLKRRQFQALPVLSDLRLNVLEVQGG